MLLKACNRCGNLIPYGRPYCERCAPIIEGERKVREDTSRKESNRRYNQNRNKKEGTFYRSKEWKILSRDRIRADGYKCVKCGAFATEVDHIIPIQTPEGWDLRYEWSNLQSLCKSCHNEKHNRFKKGRRGRPGLRPQE